MSQALHAVLDKTKERSTSSLLLSLEGVGIRYDDVPESVVEDIHFSLYEGQSVLFLGPSGCGKSTLAMLCGGLIPASVEADVAGQVWRHPCLEKPGQVGFVFQDPEAQFCMLSVADEIAFGLENLSVPRDKMNERIQECLIHTNLDVQLNASHNPFSGGMKQKLALACALALKPSLLIFDEPTANLDPLSTKQVFQQIASLHKCGQTMIVIEHKFEALVPEMDQVVLFNRHGRIHRIGNAEKVVCEEWDWLIDEGIVDPWKRPYMNGQSFQNVTPLQKQSDFPFRTRDSKEISTPAIELNHVGLTLDKKKILNDINLSVKEGAFVAVVGPNGAGKSSLLQVAAGLLRPNEGIAKLQGSLLAEMSKKVRAKAIAYCFQNPEFQFIYERVGDELANYRAGNEVPDEVQVLLESYGLSGTEAQSPFALSQGQKRRLSVAAMVRDEHEIYFLDEPTFGQDAKTKEAIMNHLLRLNEDGKTIVMTTHDMELVNRYATNVVVVVNGQIRFYGTPDALNDARDVLADAHLLDDVDSSLFTSKAIVNESEKVGTSPNEGKGRRLPIQYFHPVWLMIGLLIVAGISIGAQTFPQTLALFCFAIVLLFSFAWMTPWKIGKLLLPFVVFYVIYIWSFAANAAVPPGEKSIHFLWWTLSFYGLKEGIILAFRMLSSVLFGILFIWNMDMSDLMVGLSKDFRIPPKFAYGTLAGLRVIPLFTTEWMKLRQARQLRGRDARFAIFRPVIYAIPLLSQAIRMSERVAIAMEARGMIGKPASYAKERTYYRTVTVHWWDFAAQIVFVVVAVLCISVIS